MYLPTTRPHNSQFLADWTENELRRLSQDLTSPQEVLRLGKTNVAPARPREGDIRFADGTNWNPGAGQGIYAYYGGAWNKL